jgi:Flp pilus assembly pilin Flp
MLQMIQSFVLWLKVVVPQDEKGQGFVEYAFLIIFIALLVIVGLTALAGGINGLFNALGNAMNTNATKVS